MADDLPRPVTPGPWRLVTSPEDPMEYERISYWVTAEGAITDEGMPHTSDAFEVRDEALGRLLCSLPERIRRMDAVRNYCSQVIRPERNDQMTARVAARTILALLDGAGEA